MSRIPAIFDTLRSQGRTGLMPFITGGYPSPEVSQQVLKRIGRAGASIVEIGIPFSDPIADGPVIAASMHETLERGVTPRTVFEIVRSVRASVELGLVAMLSESIIERMGVERFLEEASDAGFDGLIVPDADTNGGAESPAGIIARAATEHGLTCTFLIAPTTSESRMDEICALCSGFIYLLARVGITGENHDAPDIAAHVSTVRGHTDLPIAVGFGISTPLHVAAVTAHADAAIVGSALVRRMGTASDPVEDAAEFVTELATGLFRGFHRASQLAEWPRHPRL